MRVGMMALCASMALQLVACGGGGGGAPSGTDDTQASAAQTPAKVVDAIDSITTAAGEGLSAGDAFLGMAKILTSSSQAVMASSATTISGACGNADGTAQITWADGNNDTLRGIGDTITVQYANCTIAQAGAVLTGTVVMSVTSKTADTLGLSVDFGAGLLLIDPTDMTPSHILGTVTVTWSDDGLTRQIKVASTSKDDLKVTAANQSTPSSSVFTEQFKALLIKNTLSREHARSNTSLAFKLTSEYLGASFTVTTPHELSGFFDTFPDLGAVEVRADGSSAIALIQPIHDADSSKFSYHVDANGDGTADEVGYGLWNDLTTGIMWWGEDMGQQSTFSKSATQPVSSSSFAILKSVIPSVMGDGKPFMTIQFSHELSAADVPNLRLSGPNRGNNDVDLWAPQIVPLTVDVKGAYVRLIPTLPLQHDVVYALQTVPVNGDYPQASYVDTSGNRLVQTLRTYATDNSLIAHIAVAPATPVLVGSAPTTVSANTSQSAHGIVSYEWTRLAGAPVVFGDATAATTSVVLASNATNSDISTTVQLKIVDAAGQVEYARKVITALADPVNGAYLSYRSDPGDYLGQGQAFTSVAINGGFEANDPPNYLVFATFNMPDPSWLLILKGNNVEPFHVGPYENASRPSIPSGPGNGLSYSGNGNGCNESTGRFDVLDIAYDSGGHVVRLAVDFETHCEGRVPGLYGSFRYHSTIPVRP